MKPYFRTHPVGVLYAGVTAGPYRVLRHPGYAGSLLAVLGIGVRLVPLVW